MEQIDNFLNPKDLKDLKEVILDPTFPWALNHGVSYADDGHIQFTHTIYKDDEFKSTWTLGGLDIFKQKLGITSIVRAKVNLLPRHEKIIVHEAHIDIPNPPDNLKTAILYLNTNNGYTTLETGEKISSVENRLIKFDAKTKHSVTTNSCEQPYRVVFNLNYF